jgi:hypothetical protein
VAGLPEEVLLERELHGVGLRSGDEHLLGRWAQAAATEVITPRYGS